MKKYFIFIFLLLNSCIPVKLPPIVAVISNFDGVSQVDKYQYNRFLYKKLAVVVAPEVSCGSRQVGETSLGNQFILGLIPLTSVYSSNEVDCILTEIIASELSHLNFDVVIAPQEALWSFKQLPSYAFTISGHIVKPHVAAYDFIFFRRISTGGLLQIAIVEGLNNKEVSYQTEFSDATYRQYAFTNTMALYFEKSIREAFQALVCRDLVGQCSSSFNNYQIINSAYKFQIKETKSSAIMILSFPEINENMSEVIQTKFKLLPGQLGRFFQKSQEEALLEKQINSISVLNFNFLSEEFWQLRNKILDINFDEEGKILLVVDYSIEQDGKVLKNKKFKLILNENNGLTELPEAIKSSILEFLSN